MQNVATANKSAPVESAPNTSVAEATAEKAVAAEPAAETPAPAELALAPEAPAAAEPDPLRRQGKKAEQWASWAGASRVFDG